MGAGGGSGAAELRKQQAGAGGINYSSCFVIGEVLAVTRAADSICCLVVNRGPITSGASGMSQENPNLHPWEGRPPEPGTPGVCHASGCQFGWARLSCPSFAVAHRSGADDKRVPAARRMRGVIAVIQHGPRLSEPAQG